MPAWRPVHRRTRSRGPLTLALDIARRYSDPALVERAVKSARAQSSEPQSIYWRPEGLAQGDAGIALMYGYFDACFPDQGWDRVAHGWLERAAHGAANAARLPNSLFEGVSGLAFAVAYLSRGGRRYRNLLGNLHEHVVAQAHIDSESLPPAATAGALPFLMWDVIAGLTGAGVYLLTRNDQAALEPILRCLIDMTHDRSGLPGWHTAPQMGGSWLRAAYPHGHLNCGLAHGIPGPLALFSLARCAGVELPGLEAAIDRIANWLTAHRLQDRWGPNWPSAVPLVLQENRLSVGVCDGLSAAHAGWCYGSPGVARALWYAGCARRNRSYAALALDSMHAVMRRPGHAQGLSSPAMCHGFAGLLCTTLRFRHESGDARFSRFARRLVRTIETLHEPDTLLGYRTVEPGGARIDQAGLLDGAPGVAMALLAASTAIMPSWDRIFLLS